MKLSVPWSRLLSTARAFCVAWACVLAWKKVYAIDEFFWAHRAWASLRGGARGLVDALPFAGIELLYGPLAFAARSRPENMLWLRLVPLLGLLLFLAAAALWWRRHGHDRDGSWGCLFALLALNSPTALRHAVEIRPDGPAWALLCAGIVLGVGRNALRDWFLSSLCLILACMLSVKSAFVLLPLLPIFGIDLRRAFRHSEPRWFPRPHLTLGLGLLLFLPLLFSGAVADACRGIWMHQRLYPALPRTLHLWPALREAPWLAAFAVLTARDVQRAERRKQPAPPHAVWLPLWIGAGLSYLAQRSAYPYSLLPWWGTSCFLAVHALRWLRLRWNPRKFPRTAQPFGLALLALSLIGVPHRSGLGLTNEPQQETLRELGLLTDPVDPVFDMSASYAFRPPAGPRPFVDEAYRMLAGIHLTDILIQAIEESGTTVFIPDGRSLNRWRHGDLSDYLEKHFHPLTPDLHLYGQRWRMTGEPRSERFVSPRDATYFVHASGLADVRLRVDGRDLAPGDRIKLARGEWTVELGGRPVGENPVLSLLWLPRDGRAWRPLDDPGFPLHARYILPR